MIFEQKVAVMHSRPLVAISAPYPEGAIMKLAYHWEKAGHLETVIRPSRLFNRCAASLIQPFASDLAERVGKKSYAGPNVREYAPQVEALRLLSRTTPLPSAFTHSVVAGKVMFDRSVARQADLGEASIFVGMPEASLRSFERFARVVKILHEVDTHPRYHNEALFNVYGKKQARHETYSEDRVERMEAELELANYILVPSRIVADKMVEHGISADKIVNVPYGVDFDKFTVREAGQYMSKTNRKPRVLYVGQIGLRKGIPFLIEAAKISGVRIDLIGSVIPGMPLPDLPDNVRYLGTLPHRKLSEELNSADAYVFPSLEDACPLTVIEAAAAGLPIIMTPQVGSGELFRTSEVRWVKEADSQDLAAALREVTVLTMEERLERAHRVREGVICSVMSWEQYGAEVYQRLASVVRDVCGTVSV